MKKNLKHISDVLSSDMVNEDSLGNYNYSDDYDYNPFTDSEETNHYNKVNAVLIGITNEINSIKQQESQKSKYKIVKSESGKNWEGTPYWTSQNGEILISDLTDDHLSKIPRHLYNRGMVDDKYDLPPQITAEIKKRGFVLLNNCIVLQK